MLEQVEKKNPKEYWDIIKQLKERKADNIICNPGDFRTFYEKLFSLDKDKEQTEEQKRIEKEVIDMLENTGQDDTRRTFSMEELKPAVKKLKNNKAGPDAILAEMLKESPEEILNIILSLINKIVVSCKYPARWAEGITSLLLKEGDEDDPNNYRAITVASAISKVLALMIEKRLEEHIEKNKVRTHLQIGFEKKTRPADHIFVLRNLIDSYLVHGKPLFACFVDFQKAYDSVWRMGMYYELLKSGIDKNIIKLIKNMYDKTSLRLKMNGQVTPPFKTYKGVRQGCILSPRLFNMFINDLPEIFDQHCDPVKLGNIHLQCLMYADDIVILSESQKGLQTCMTKLEHFADKWEMKLNKKKTEIISFQKQSKMPKINITFQG